MKKVLIALDYDSTAKKVAETGFSFAKAMNAEVTLLHVVTDSAYYSSIEYSPIMGFNGFSSPDFYKIINLDGLKVAAQYFLDKLKLHLDNDAIQTLVEEGELAETILKTAKHLHVDILVMGSHSRGMLEQIVLGSITENVLRNTSIPLLIIPTKEHHSK